MKIDHSKQACRIKSSEQVKLSTLNSNPKRKEPASLDFLPNHPSEIVHGNCYRNTQNSSHSASAQINLVYTIYEQECMIARNGFLCAPKSNRRWIFSKHLSATAERIISVIYHWYISSLWRTTDTNLTRHILHTTLNIASHKLVHKLHTTSRLEFISSPQVTHKTQITHTPNLELFEQPNLKSYSVVLSGHLNQLA